MRFLKNWEYNAMKIKFYILIFLFSCVPLSYSEYTKEEVILAKIISAEACGEGFIGMFAVSNVIKNRAIKYNLSPYLIAIQKNQFYGYTAKNRDKLFYQCQNPSLFLAKYLMELPDITDNALYFKTQYEQMQKWHNIKTITIKNHEFWR